MKKKTPIELREMINDIASRISRGADYYNNCPAMIDTDTMISLGLPRDTPSRLNPRAFRKYNIIVKDLRNE